MAFWFSTRLNSRSVNRPYLCSTASEEGKWIQNCKTIKNGHLAWITSHIDESTIVDSSSYFWEIWEIYLRGIDTLDAVRSTGLDLPSTTHAEWVGRAILDPSIRACRWCHPPLQKDKGDKGPKKIHQIALALAWHVYENWRNKKFWGNSLKSNKSRSTAFGIELWAWLHHRGHECVATITYGVSLPKSPCAGETPHW